MPRSARALSDHATNGTLGVVSDAVFTRAVDSAAAALVAAWGQELPLLSSRARTRRRSSSRSQPRKGSGHRSRRAEDRRRRLGPRRPVTEGRAAGSSRGGPREPPSERGALAPVVSEKSYSLIGGGKYVFKVHPDSHKTQIRQAVEELFGVHVEGVNVLKVQAKPKRRGQTKGIRPGLEEGHRAAARGRDHRDLRRGTGLVMPVRKFKPTSPDAASCRSPRSRRSRKSTPEKSLTEKLTKKGGRNNNGRITTRQPGWRS